MYLRTWVFLYWEVTKIATLNWTLLLMTLKLFRLVLPLTSLWSFSLQNPEPLFIWKDKTVQALFVSSHLTFTLCELAVLCRWRKRIINFKTSWRYVWLYICLECDRGYYFNLTTWSCAKCPRNTTQENKGQKMCEICPSDRPITENEATVSPTDCIEGKYRKWWKKYNVYFSFSMN